jgi:hypothetical protein
VVEADLVDEQARRLDAEQRSDRPLKADRDVAKPDGPVACVEQCSRDDSDGIGEIDDPGAVRRELTRAVGNRQYDGHRSQGLRQAARAGRLLADAAAGERHGLVGEPCLLAADANLQDHEVGSIERAVEVAGQRELAGERLSSEHPAGKPSDDLQALGVDVLEDELRNVEAFPLACEPRDELRRIRRASADDRNLHPFTPVSVTPSTKTRCARKKITITGAITSSVAAIVRFHCTWWSERNSESPIESTQLCGFSAV